MEKVRNGLFGVLGQGVQLLGRVPEVLALDPALGGVARGHGDVGTGHFAAKSGRKRREKSIASFTLKKIASEEALTSHKSFCEQPLIRV